MKVIIWCVCIGIGFFGIDSFLAANFLRFYRLNGFSQVFAVLTYFLIELIIFVFLITLLYEYAFYSFRILILPFNLESFFS